MNRAAHMVESMIVEPLEWVREQGIVLQSARGPVPNLAEYVAGEPIRGSWWGHASGHEIFAVLSRVLNSPEVIATRLVNGKVTLIHRRLWPALVRVADRFPKERWAAVDEEHTASGAHRTIEIPFPEWSLPKKSPPLSYSLSTTRSHNCQPASADPGAWTSLRWGRAGRGDCPQVLGSDHRRLRASAGDESPAREYAAADSSTRPSRPAGHDAHQCDQTSERSECRPSSSTARANLWAALVGPRADRFPGARPRRSACQ
jgi:hypothetical protein